MITLLTNNAESPKLKAKTIEGIQTDSPEFAKVLKLVKSAKKEYLATKEQYGFRDIVRLTEDQKLDLQLAKAMAKGKNAVVVIGIGGSDLGMRAIANALLSLYHNEEQDKNPQQDSLKIYFAGDTTDPKSLLDLSAVLELEKTIFLVISKSGNTVEQASTFVYLRNLVAKSLGEQAAIDQFLFITDPESGTLRELSKKHGYRAVSIPSNVGGRFSVLSNVGLVPALLVGVEVEQMLQGAADLQSFHEEISEDNLLDDPIAKYVATQLYYYRKEKNISVMLPYNYALGSFSKWYQQLWAESLGKALDKEGKTVNVGMTPTAALGPMDQHSQLQLYNEGPKDKFVTLIIAENPEKDLFLPQDYKGLEQFAFLKDKRFYEILQLEKETTAFALTSNGVPNVTLQLPTLDAYHLGQLFYFFEVSVALFGLILNVDAFNQPGVELQKNAMLGVLGKPGYEKERAAFKAHQS